MTAGRKAQPDHDFAAGDQCRDGLLPGCASSVSYGKDAGQDYAVAVYVGAVVQTVEVQGRREHRVQKAACVAGSMSP